MFKEGQRVKIKEDCSGAIKGEILKLEKRVTNGTRELWTVDGDGRALCNCQSNWKLQDKELKDVEFGDMITDGKSFVYILGRVDEAIFVGVGLNTEKQAREANAIGDCLSSTEFLRNYRDYKLVEESDDVEITVDGKTTTISKKSAKALNLI